MLVTGIGVPARAADPITVDTGALASQLFAGLAEVRFGDDLGLVKAATVSADFLEWRRLHPVATLGESQAELAAEKQLLDSGLTATDLQRDEPALMARSIELLSAPAAGPARSASHIRAFVAGLAGSAVGPLDNREDLSEGALTGLSWVRNRPALLSNLWADVRRTAADDSVFAQAWNAVLGAPVSLDAAASLDQLKAADELRGLVDLDKLLSLTGDPDAFAAAAHAQVAIIFDDISTLGAQVNAQALIQASNCPATTPPATTCTAANQKAAEKKADEQESAVDRYKAALDALDPVLKEVDSTFANQVKVVGGAVVTAVKAVAKYAEDISKISGVASKIFSLATVTMTGNVFGAVMSVVGLFGADKPDISQQILDQVKELQGQVKDLQKEMAASFERIDARLNTIYNTMISEFDKLSDAIAGNAAQLQVLQQNVAQLGLRLEEVTASILTAIGQAELVNVRTSIDKYIGYAEQFGTPIPAYQPDYVGAETDLHLASTQLADDAAFVLPATDADNPALDPAAVLNSNGETRSINYLARYASKRDPAIVVPSSPLGNLGVWDLGGQAYALLQLQNPDYARQVASSRSNDIQIAGQRILDTAASFTHPVTAPDPAGGYRNNLFKSLDTDYRTGVQNLSAALTTIRTSDVLNRYEPNADGAQIKTPKTYELFWDGSTALSPAPPVPTDPAKVTSCDGSAQIDRPANVSLAKLPDQVKLINYAYAPRLDQPPAGAKELPEVSICESPSWTNIRYNEPEGSGVRSSYGHLRLDIHLRYRLNPTAAWQNVVTTAYTWPEEIKFETTCTIFSCHTYLEPGTQLGNTWANSARYAFEANAKATTDATAVTAATASVRQFLLSRQKFLYDSVSAALTNPSSPASAAIRSMNTARRLTQAYAQLGFPIAVQSDPVLSGLLSGQYRLLGDLPADPTITGAVQIARDNYSCGSTCPVDTQRPIKNQTFTEPTDPPCATFPAGPGDPLGNCLVEQSLRRADNLKTRFDVHFKQLYDGDYHEQLPSIAQTLAQLRAADRMSHSPAVTGGIGKRSGTTTQDVSLDLNQFTSGGKAPYTYTATGLPSGLTLNGALIQGRPGSEGTSTVTVTARDAGGTAGNAYQFTWTVGVADVPDVKGLGWNLAQAAITRAGLTAGSRTAKSDCTKPFGTVDSQTPAANTTATPGTAVDLVYTICAADAPVVTSALYSGGHTTVTWTDKSAGEDSFVVSRYTAAGQFVSQAAVRPSGSKTGTGTAYTFTDNTPGTCYRVEARTGGDDIVLASALACAGVDVIITGVAPNGAPLAAARRSDGRLEAFAFDDGVLAHRTQNAAGSSGGWGPWTDFGGPAGVTLTGLAAATNSSDTIEVFGVSPANQVWHRWQTSATTWSDWAIVAGALADSIAVVRNAAGALELYATNPLIGWVTHSIQQATGPNDWKSASLFEGVYNLHSVAVAKDLDGRLEVLAANPAGKTYQRQQSTPGGTTWSAWKDWAGASTRLSMVANADGHLEAFGTSTTGTLAQKYQLAPNGTTGWTDWNTTFGTGLVGVTTGVTDGRVQVFAVATDGRPQTRWQLAGGGWSDWVGW
ncbi:hypothetical protein Ate02nite_58600 [Paractinoplanes tereljensis]|uniref:PASTA domain-containing protein n=1 Tax=Paractinoplanes tereljensis TaxID=571912 RepID=A0A919NRX4_9ACTN|nr:hypothetical protein Ate02nite_58600 [Actinoplanes tereljensis]